MTPQTHILLKIFKCIDFIDQQMINVIHIWKKFDGPLVNEQLITLWGMISRERQQCYQHILQKRMRSRYLLQLERKCKIVVLFPTIKPYHPMKNELKRAASCEIPKTNHKWYDKYFSKIQKHFVPVRHLLLCFLLLLDKRVAAKISKHPIQPGNT